MDTSPPPTRLWCLRHAESENLVSGASGALPFTALTPLGRHQAAQAAETLREEKISHIYSSTSRRALETADIIATKLDIQRTALPALAGVDIGTSEGVATPSLRARIADVLRAWVVEQDLNQRVTGGEDGHQVTARVGSALEAIAAAHPGATIALVGNSSSLTAGLSAICGLGGDVWGRPLPLAVPFLLIGRHGWRCRSWPGLTR